MSISAHEQEVLESIESDLVATGPKLASMLAIFARLTAGEEMPARERIRRAFYRPAATGRRPAATGRRPAATGRPAAAGRRPVGADVAGRAGRRRNALAQLRRQSAWLVWLVAAIGLVAWTLTFSHGSGKGVCPVTRTAACRQVVPAPARPGGTVNGGTVNGGTVNGRP